MNKPKIVTAIPQRRYKLGNFLITVLGEIESADGNDYRYIAAVASEGDPNPGLYITAERALSDNQGKSDLVMRIVMHDGAQVLGSSDRWNRLDPFVTDMLEIVARVLDLQDEEPYPLS